MGQDDTCRRCHPAPIYPTTLEADGTKSRPFAEQHMLTALCIALTQPRELGADLDVRMWGDRCSGSRVWPLTTQGLVQTERGHSRIYIRQTIDLLGKRVKLLMNVFYVGYVFSG